MDCIIASPSVRPFCAAIGCLSRMGKDLYLDFDAIDGLTLRALNEAKSAFGSVQLDASFFDRCSAPLFNTNTKNKKKKKKRASQELSQQQRFTCRIPFRALAPILRPRRNVVSLRLYSNAEGEEGDDESVSFEFVMAQRWRVVHRVAVVGNADTVTAVAPTDRCSELTASPRTLLRMLEPVQKARTAEVALVLNDKYKVVTATSFHHGDVAAQTSDNALLQANHSATMLKTETSIGCDELEEFDFQDDRRQEVEEGDDLPANVNEEVVLVFGAKESKAMLQFCAQAYLEEELRVSISFHWGGKPIVMETKGHGFTAHLIMATLDHKLLEGFRTSEDAAEKNNSRAQRQGM